MIYTFKGGLSSANNLPPSPSPNYGIAHVFNGSIVSDDSQKITPFLSPLLWGKSDTSNNYGITFIGDTDAAEASGTELIRFEARQGNQVVLNRPTFAWYNYTALQMIMLANGNLGLGTANPTERLHVIGNIKVSGSISASNLSGNNSGDQDLSGLVPKVDGKDLSSNDFDDILKDKLDRIEDDANNYTHPLSHPASIITQDENNRLVTDIEKEIWNAKQEAGDYATLENGLVSINQLPGFVDDVLEFDNFASFPESGERGKLYVDMLENLTYRWSGTIYTEVSKSLGLGETSGTAYRGDRGKTAYDHSQLISGNPHNSTASDVGAEPTLTSDIKLPSATDKDGQILSVVNGMPIWSGNILTGVTNTGLQITSTRVNEVPLVIKGFSGQTANLQEWQNSTGTIIARIGSDGKLYAGGSILSTAIANATTGANSLISLNTTGTVISRNINDDKSALIVNQIHASSTGAIQEWQFNGTQRARITAGGNFILSGGSSFMGTLTYTSGQTYALVNPTIDGVVISRNIGDNKSALIINQAHTSSTGLITDFQFGGVSKARVAKDGTITGAAGSFGTLYNNIYYARDIINGTSIDNSKITVGITGTIIQRNIDDNNSALIINQNIGLGKILDMQFSGVSKASIDKDGLISGSGADFTITDPAKVGLTVQAATGQTADLFNVKDTDDNTLVSIGSSGRIKTNYINNPISLNYSEIVLGASGTVIKRNSTTGSALTVNHTHSGSTGKLLDLQLEGNSVANFDKDGGLTTTQIKTQTYRHPTSSTYATMYLNTSGVSFERNRIDGGTAVTINQANVASTGLILDCQFGGVSKANVDKYGAITSTNFIKSAGRKKAISTKTADYTATANDEVIVCNSINTLTITLPTAIGSGQSYYIKNINIGSVIIDGNLSETIDGQLTQTIVQWDTLEVCDYASGSWIIL